MTPAASASADTMTTDPFFQASDVTIWCADARDAAGWLPEASVDALITSPPYYGLRDYGTGRWEGGDPEHDHATSAPPRQPRNERPARGLDGGKATVNAADAPMTRRTTCSCGAVKVDGQLGLEATPDAYVEGLADLLTGYARVLKPEGSLWLNLGDTYSSRGGQHHEDGSSTGVNAQVGAVAHQRAPRGGDHPAKCLLMVPERVALALIERGWILRNKVVWAKPNGMPSSVSDRLATKWEYLFHLVRQPRYFYDLDAIREPHVDGRDVGAKGPRGAWIPNGRAFGNNNRAGGDGVGFHDAGANPGDVWSVPTQPYADAHFATFPAELVRRPIAATVPEGGIVLDPFFGAGTTAVMARRLGRCTWGVELNPDYCTLAARRLSQDVLTFDPS